MNELYNESKTYHSINFSEEELQKGEYENCIFENCKFQNVNLSDYSFAECVFEDCDLSNVKINNTIFRDIEFKNCKLIGLHFEDCNKFLLSFKFESCQLNFSSFYKLMQKNSVFNDCSLQEVDFTESDFSGSNFKNCDLSRAIFENTTLIKTDFRTSYNYSINPELNEIKKAKFSLSEIVGLLYRYDIIIEN